MFRNDGFLACNRIAPAFFAYIDLDAQFAQNRSATLAESKPFMSHNLLWHLILGVHVDNHLRIWIFTFKAECLVLSGKNGTGGHIANVQQGSGGLGVIGGHIEGAAEEVGPPYRHSVSAGASG